jgi:glycosyltransferase involved in cell wall biosynthesis
MASEVEAHAARFRAGSAPGACHYSIRQGNLKTILILSTYPAENPRNGGQVRLSSIIKAYERGGWRVLPVGVLRSEAYPDQSSLQAIFFPETSPFRLFKGQRVPFIDDLLSGSFAISDPAAWTRLLSILPRSLDAIHVEQPWLWPVAEGLRERREYSSTVLVYGSQNLEEELKRKILEPYDIPARDHILAEVAALEKRATTTADLVLAVTSSEQSVLESWGAKKIVLAQNGISPWKADSDAVVGWQSKLPAAPWLLYVASAHPPNFSAFAKLIGESLGCFPPDSALVVAGRVSRHIRNELDRSRWRDLNLSRLKLLNSLSDRDLAAVKTLAHGFFLPVQFGAGSNIKTAEALFSGKYVVGTSVAFRGFEGFRSLPEVRVADDPKSIHRAIREVLSLPAIEQGRLTEEDPLRRVLTWDHVLKDVPTAVDALIAKPLGAHPAIA